MRKLNEKLKKANLIKKDKWSVDEFKQYTGKESGLQSQCESLLRYYPNLKAVRIPDLLYFVLFSQLGGGGHRFKIVDRTTGVQIPMGWYRKISMWLTGLPDLIILKRSVGDLNLAICPELKTKKGKLSKHQKKFAETINLVEVRSFEQFEKLLKEFTDGKK